MKYLIPLLFLLSVQLFAIDVSRTVTYDSVTKAVAPSNLVFIRPQTATVPVNGNDLGNKTYIDSVVSVGGTNKLDTTNGVAVGLTTPTIPTVSNSVVNLSALTAEVGWVNVKSPPYNATGNGSFDDWPALQAALNSGLNVYLPSGNYRVSASLTNSMVTRINGQGRDTTRITATTTNAVLVFKTPLNSADNNASFELKDLSIYAENAVELNQVGIANWDTQQAIVNCRFIHCTFFGTYQSLDDPLAGSTNAPTLAFLVSEGVGIKAAKIYNTLLQNCLFRNFGIGIYFDACDINVIDTCRMVANARHVHLTRHDNQGSQNTIQNSDLLLNYRVGGVYEDQTRWNTIQNCYFETNLESSQYWINDRGEGTIFENNRIDAPVGTVPIFSINASGPGVVLSKNRGARGRTIEIKHDHLEFVNEQQTLVSFANNLTSFPETLAPQCFYSSRSDSRTWGPYSPKRLQGGATSTYPWTNSPSGMLGINTGGTSDTLIILMDTESTDAVLNISITGEMLAGPGGFLVITWGGSNVWSGDWFTSTGLQTVTRQILLPAGIAPNSGLVFTLAANQGYLCGISLGGVYGSVSSLGLTAPSFLSVADSPVTNRGTINITYSGVPLPALNGGTGLSALGSGATNALAGTATGTGGGIVRSVAPQITGDASIDGTTISVDSVNHRVGIVKGAPAYPLDVVGRISHTGGIGEGADVQLSSSGTTVIHALSATWVGQNFYAGGTNAIALTKSGTTVLGPLSTPAGQTSPNYISTIATGTAPLTVASTTEVANLRAATATALATGRTINGTVFNGTANVTVTAAAATLTGLGTGVNIWLATPSSANLAAAITDETGTGALMFATSPTVTGTLTATTAVATPTIKDGSDTLLSSSGTTVQHATSATWVGQQFFAGGTNAVSITKSGTTVLGPLTVSGNTTSIKAAAGTITHLAGFSSDPTAGAPFYSSVLGAGVATLLAGASSGTGGPAGTTSPSLTSPTFLTGATLGNGGGNTILYINGGSGGVRGFDIATAGSYRWRIATSGAEGGSNAGSDVLFQSFDDAGAALSYPFQVNRVGSISLRAPASGSAGTYFPAWTGDPASTTMPFISRTAAQVRSDIGAGTGSGTVTSVGLTVPSGLTASGTPITGSGTLAITTTLNGHVSGNGSGLTASATIPSTDITVTENTQTGTTYTVLSSDNGKVVTLNNAGAITVTVPTLSSGFSCTFIQKGAGQVTFTSSGTTVSNAHSQTKTFGQYAAVTLYGLSSTAFVLAGDTGI